MPQLPLPQALQQQYGSDKQWRFFWVRCAFAGLAILFFGGLINRLNSTQPIGERLDDTLIVSGALLTCVSMVLNWSGLLGLYLPWGAPGSRLGLASKLLGSIGLTLLPTAIYYVSPLWIATCCALPILSWKLWFGGTWAVYPWFSLPVLVIGGFSWHIGSKFVALAPELWAGTPEGVGQFIGTSMKALLAGFGMLIEARRFVQELNEWRRRPQADAKPALPTDRSLDLR